MKKFFNTTGPCRPECHYMLDPVARVATVKDLIDREQYFVIHAPGQSGKTTLLQGLAKDLTQEGKYTVLRVSCKVGRAFGDDFAGAEQAIVQEIINEGKISLSPEWQPPQSPPPLIAGVFLKTFLGLWSAQSSKPIVLIFDEIDALTDAALGTLLRQLRAGFSYRPDNFPQSVILCGLQDVRDYKVTSGGTPGLGTPSPFNIKAESIRLCEFAAAEVHQLYLQHTAATGQEFTPEALAKACELTGGQPWLVNALAREVIEEIGVPISESITATHMEEAAQRLILARPIHLAALAEKLNEDRVKRILAPVLAGTVAVGDANYGEDVLYARDLGLILQKSPLTIANPIYKDFILRVLCERVTGSIVLQRPSYVDENGLLNVLDILEDFAMLWKQNAEVMLQGHVYHEVAAQIVFMAWLQRVVNGGGIIDSEYGIGRGRIDLLIRWPVPAAKNPRQWQREVFELKLWTAGQPDPLAQGLQQLERYLDGLNLNHGTLVIFDRRPKAKSLTERTSLTEAKTPKGYAVRLLRA